MTYSFPTWPFTWLVSQEGLRYKFPGKTVLCSGSLSQERPLSFFFTYCWRETNPCFCSQSRRRDPTGINTGRQDSVRGTLVHLPPTPTPLPTLDMTTEVKKASRRAWERGLGYRRVGLSGDHPWFHVAAFLVFQADVKLQKHASCWSSFTFCLPSHVLRALGSVPLSYLTVVRQAHTCTYLCH